MVASRANDVPDHSLPSFYGMAAPGRRSRRAGRQLYRFDMGTEADRRHNARVQAVRAGSCQKAGQVLTSPSM
jgi:hypothetical protein